MRMTTIKLTAAALAALALGSAGWAQDNPLPGVALAEIEGHWEGTGWAMGQDGQRQTFDVFEEAIIHADGYAVIVLGEGYAPEGSGRDGRPVHNAAGFITRMGEAYEMRAITGEGRMQDASMVLTEDGFDWTLDLGPNGSVQYSTTIVDNVWTESGSYCAPSGQCYPTFFMRLEKVE